MSEAYRELLIACSIYLYENRKPDVNGYQMDINTFRISGFPLPDGHLDMLGHDLESGMIYGNANYSREDVVKYIDFAKKEAPKYKKTNILAQLVCNEL